MGEKGEFSVGTPEGNKTLWRPLRRYGNNIKMGSQWNMRMWTEVMSFATEISGELFWTRQWTFGFHKILGNLFSCWATVGFSRMTQLRGVSLLAPYCMICTLLLLCFISRMPCHAFCQVGARLSVASVPACNIRLYADGEAIKTSTKPKRTWKALQNSAGYWHITANIINHVKT
jgi:hypothetical protein